MGTGGASVGSGSRKRGVPSASARPRSDVMGTVGTNEAAGAGARITTTQSAPPMARSNGLRPNWRAATSPAASDAAATNRLYFSCPYTVVPQRNNSKPLFYCSLWYKLYTRWPASRPVKARGSPHEQGGHRHRRSNSKYQYTPHLIDRGLGGPAKTRGSPHGQDVRRNIGSSNTSHHGLRPGPAHESTWATSWAGWCGP